MSQNETKVPTSDKFVLSQDFLSEMRKLKVKMGFNGLGLLVYYRTYSRIKDDGNKESWQDTIQRVVEGTFSTQKKHILSLGKPWNEDKARRSAEEMYRRLFSMKFLPGGRGLFAQNTKILTEKNLNAALYNCAFVSTKNIDVNPTEPFEFFIDFLALGAGVGFTDTGKDKIMIRSRSLNSETFIVPDSREGWVEALKKLLQAYLVEGITYPIFDYSHIRPVGAPLKTFGGISSGFEPLKDMLDGIDQILSKHAGSLLSSRNINDIFCLIAKSICAGNIRRSSSISFGSPLDDGFINLKNYTLNPERQAFGWNSNNSILVSNDEKENSKINWDKITEQISQTGEPGIFFIDNARAYSRMNGEAPDWKDDGIEGCNPCGEIPLHPFEMCNLVECFIAKATDYEDFQTTLKYAFLYGKTVTLMPVHCEKSKIIMDKNRRVGTSLTGITDFVALKDAQGLNGKSELKEWMNRGYKYLRELDKKYSAWFDIPESNKITTVKPSGTLSLLGSSSPGVHFHTSQYYLRRIRMANTDPLLKFLANAGYRTEPCVGNETSTCCLEVPINCAQDYGLDNLKTIKDVSIWDQFELTCLAQEHWSDNAVSSTITFKSHEIKDIATIIKLSKNKLKGISFLPSFDDDSSPYPQMPYETISKETFLSRCAELKEVDYSKISSALGRLARDGEGEKYCTTDVCLK